LNYAKWKNDLEKDIGLYGINLPGRERLFGELFLTNYQDLIESLAFILQKMADCPFFFFGHSFGSLTAYFTHLN